MGLEEEMSEHEALCSCCDPANFEVFLALEAKDDQAAAAVAGGAMGGKGVSMNWTAGEVIPSRVQGARQVRDRAVELAKAHKDKPVSAVSDAAWNNDPALVSGDSVGGFTSHIHEAFGPVTFVLTFANVSVLETDAGFVLVDCGSALVAPRLPTLLDEIRAKSQAPEKPVIACIYTHGHVDHCMFHLTGFDDPEDNFGVKPKVFAHENCGPRFDRYIATNGYNTHINKRQFQLPDMFRFPDYFRYPDVTYTSETTLTFGDTVLELHHGKGETDDATMVWMPQEKFCFAGDFFIYASPNAGNPCKVQRYPLEWIAALRKMQAWEPRILFPGHGPPIIGADRVARALDETARMLESVCTPTMKMINEGKSLTFIMNNVRGDASLMTRPYLKNTYDDDRFICATLWRRYAGWYTQEITRLLPVEKSSVATELAKLVSAQALAQHALALVANSSDNVGTALELVEFAVASDPSNAELHKARATILRKYESREPCLMAQSIFRAEAIESEKLVAKASKM